MLCTKSPKDPPVTVMSSLTKSVLTSLRVKVTVAVSVVPMVDLSIETAILGGWVSMMRVYVALVPPEGVLAV